MPKSRAGTRSTASDSLAAWKLVQQQKIKLVIDQLGVFLSEARKFKSDVERIMNGVSAGAEKLSSAIHGEIERRRDSQWERLVRENGNAEADRLVADGADYTATPNQDDADEALASRLSDIPSADADDAFGRVSNALDDLRDELKEIDRFLRDLK